MTCAIAAGVAAGTPATQAPFLRVPCVAAGASQQGIGNGDGDGNKRCSLDGRRSRRAAGHPSLSKLRAVADPATCGKRLHCTGG